MQIFESAVHLWNLLQIAKCESNAEWQSFTPAHFVLFPCVGVGAGAPNSVWTIAELRVKEMPLNTIFENGFYGGRSKDMIAIMADIKPLLPEQWEC